MTENRWNVRAERGDADGRDPWGPNRFGINLMIGDTVGYISFAEEDQALAVIDAVNGNASDLPPGVHRALGTLTALGQDACKLKGWEWFDAITFDWLPADAGGMKAGCVYEVRPVPAPEPELDWVRLDQLIGRTLPGKDWAIGEFHTRDRSTIRVREQYASTSWEDITPDADGMVAVLPKDPS